MINHLIRYKVFLSNRIGIKAAIAIRDYLSRHRILEFLCLEHLCITDDMSNEIIEGVIITPSLNSLNLRGNNISCRGLLKLGELISKTELNELNLSLNKLNDDVNHSKIANKFDFY